MVTLEGTLGTMMALHAGTANLKWSTRTLAVSLSQIARVKTDSKTREATEDCDYWVWRGVPIWGWAIIAIGVIALAVIALRRHRPMKS